MTFAFIGLHFFVEPFSAPERSSMSDIREFHCHGVPAELEYPERQPGVGAPGVICKPVYVNVLCRYAVIDIVSIPQ